MDGFDVVLVRIVPDFAVRVEVSRSAMIDPISSTTHVDQLALETADLRLLPGDNSGYEIASERITSVDRDIMLFAQSTDLLGVIESADSNPISLEGGLELVFGPCATDVGSYMPIWVSLLDGFYVRCSKRHVSLAISRAECGIVSYLRRSRKRHRQ